MELLSPKHLQAVVTLGIQNTPERMKTTGQPMDQIATGFMYAYPISENMDEVNDGYNLWLVTCKHVIEKAKEKEDNNEILMRFNKSDGHEMQTFSTSLEQGKGPDWTLHPEADVAVIPGSWQDLESKGLRWETFAAGRNVLTRSKIVENGIHEGDGVFILGFPIGWMEGRQDYPIVRYGVLAQIQGWLNEEHDTFLVDGSGFPGNSGGPVVTKPQTMIVDDKKVVLGVSLLGMVSAYKVNSVAYKDSAYIKENADLINIVPIDAVNEAIELARQS